jgi:hypothetical protein
MHQAYILTLFYMTPVKPVLCKIFLQYDAVPGCWGCGPSEVGAGRLDVKVVVGEFEVPGMPIHK